MIENAVIQIESETNKKFNNKLITPEQFEVQDKYQKQWHTCKVSPSMMCTNLRLPPEIVKKIPMSHKLVCFWLAHFDLKYLNFENMCSE